MRDKTEYIIAISGASGVLYSKKLFDTLRENGSIVHLIISTQAKKILKSELGLSCSYFQKAGAVIHNNSQLNDKIASGSFRHNGMVIVPSSMGCIGRIASGVSTDLTTRAADIALKERMTLISVPRETPYNTIHLKNMLTLSEAGAIILPASPGFYRKPKTIDDLSSFLVDKILLNLHVEKRILPTWKPEKD